jgi:hypothetical protein
MKMSIFRDVALCSMVETDRRFRGAYCLHHQGALVMEALSTSETSVDFYHTARRNIPEESHLHAHRRENLISHMIYESLK